jgi:molybdenum cofactor cytidylyltransferase
MDQMQVGCVILAAGASTRMGANKMLLPVDGVPMVRRAVRVAREAALTPIVVVVGHEAALVRQALVDDACVFVENPAFTGPTSTSLHAGLQALDASVHATFVMLGDMVHTSSAMLRTLLEELLRSNAPLAVSRYGDVLAPPLLFRRALWPELLAWHGEGCGKAVVKVHEHEAAIVDWAEPQLTDIDTPSDYAALDSGSM